MPTINNADGSVRDANWPPQNKPVMLEQIREAARKAAQDTHDAAKVARGGLKSHSTLGVLFDGRIRRKNNTTGEIEIIEL